MGRLHAILSLVLAGLLLPLAAAAQPFSAAEQLRVDRLVASVLAKSGTPSASVAVVRGGHLAFAKAYGAAVLRPRRAATVRTRYDTGSVSKQFTAALILQLADEGKLSLDDKVGRFLPGVSGADQVTIRELLSQTTGYRSYAVVSYLPPAMRRNIKPQQIVDTFGHEPLMFPPGSRWDYSNTNYVIAGRIVEVVTGRSLADVLATRIFRPLAMTSAGATGVSQPKAPGDAVGYTRVALGPRRTAAQMPSGWKFGAGGLSMTAVDLAIWDMAILDRRLLSAGAYKAQQTSVRLSGGSDTGYGLGLYVRTKGGHRILEHDGIALGYLTENQVYPDDGEAVVVTVNADFGSAHTDISDGLQAMLLGDLSGGAAPRAPPPKPSAPETTALATRVLDDFANGRLERNLFTPADLSYFTSQVRADLKLTLLRLGPPSQIELLRREPWEGYDGSIHEISWHGRKLILVMLRAADGRLDDFNLFSPD